jgi:hypothetical protein
VKEINERQKEGTMEKSHLGTGLAIFTVVLILSGCAEKPYRLNSQIVVKNSSCRKLVSIRNDGSMPKESLTQRYAVECEDQGEINGATLEMTVDNNGDVKETKLVGSDKAMGGSIQVTPSAKQCEDGEELRCVRVCDFPLEGAPHCYEICWCIKFYY